MTQALHEPIDERYLKWLYSQVARIYDKNPSRTHWQLFKVLYSTRYEWFVPNDDNRIEDARLLRERYLRDHSVYDEEMWLNYDTSILEVIFTLAEHMTYETERSIGYEFWRLIENLGIKHHNDAIFGDQSVWVIEHACDRINKRTYLKTGRGGLFPLKHPREDQREVELWYQMGAYLLENDND